jgi:hypothetical protein
MSTQEIKKEIHEYVESADSRILKLIYAMMIADKYGEAIPDWHRTIVEERLIEFEANPGNTTSWEDLKKKIESMR